MADSEESPTTVEGDLQELRKQQEALRREWEVSKRRRRHLLGALEGHTAPKTHANPSKCLEGSSSSTKKEEGEPREDVAKRKEPHEPKRPSSAPPVPNSMMTDRSGVITSFGTTVHHSAGNDYSQHYIDTRKWPQNFLRDRSDMKDRYLEYPKHQRLVELKDELVHKHATPPMFLKCDLRTFDLTSLGALFDVVLVDPPWEEYSRRAAHVGKDVPCWSFDEIINLPVEKIVDSPSFLFLWVGSEEGLDQGRVIMRKWGFRRVEDICWVKTNRTTVDVDISADSARSLLVHTKEHCLMGIRGQVRRSTDGNLIHANVDTDVVIAERESVGCTRKPPELYHIAEHFCLGMRRLELFGEDHNIRPGWVTLGTSLSSSNFNPKAYAAQFANGHYLPFSKDIETMRPKSPPRDRSKPPSARGRL